MAQPVKFYVCYALEDKNALSNLEKCLRPLERSGKIQFWHRGKMLPGDNHDQQIVTQLDQAQAIIMLVSANLFTPEYYDSAEMTYAFQRHQKAKVRVIPVIVEHCGWQQPPLGELSPLPAGGKPAGRDDKAWSNVGIGIGGIATHIQAEQAKREPVPSASPATTRAKSRKSARAKAQPLSEAALTVKKPRVTRTSRPTRPNTPLKPEPLDHQPVSDAEPEPVTSEARTSTPAYDQNYEKLQHKIHQIVLDILVWEPALPFHEPIVASERRAIYQSLQAERHQCQLGTQLQVPPGLSLQDTEIEQARDADMTILLVEAPAFGEMHEFCSDYDENILHKTLCFYPEVKKSSPGSWGLDEILEGFNLEYYQEDDITDCRVRTKVLKWVEARCSCRYRKQRRSGR
jgi:hypothetical protein